MPFVKEYTDIEFLSDLSQIISENPTASQRDISGSVGVSIAIINGLIKKCVTRGWVATKNLTLKKLQYMITPEGFDALTERSFSFVKRNFAELNRYKRNIEAHILRAKENGKRRVVLYGRSDISFLIEGCCRELGMEFLERESLLGDVVVGEDEFVIVGDESINIEEKTVFNVYSLLI